MVRLGVQCSVLPMRSHPLIFDREILDVFMGSVVEIEEKVPPRPAMIFLTWNPYQKIEFVENEPALRGPTVF